jgi:hypothetical protein
MSSGAISSQALEFYKKFECRLLFGPACRVEFSYNKSTHAGGILNEAYIPRKLRRDGLSRLCAETKSKPTKPKYRKTILKFG